MNDERNLRYATLWSSETVRADDLGWVEAAYDSTQAEVSDEGGRYALYLYRLADEEVQVGDGGCLHEGGADRDLSEVGAGGVGWEDVVVG